MAKKKKEDVTYGDLVNEDRKIAIEMTVKALENRFGPGIISIGNEATNSNIANISKWVSTGIPMLDHILSGGRGLPGGRHIELLGWEASGKSSTCLTCIAQAQKQGGLVAYIDTEHALDLDYAQAIGVDISNLAISQPNCAEQALEIADVLCKSGAYSMIVIDSVAALTPKDEIESEAGAHHVGKLARLMSQALRKLDIAAKKTNTIFLWVNQYREKIGVMFGSPLTTPGGNALKFYTSIRIEAARAGYLGDKDLPRGIITRFKCIKNKVSSPYRKAEIDLVFGEGFDPHPSTIDFLVGRCVILQKGSWFQYKGETIAQGRENAAEWFASKNKKEQEELLSLAYNRQEEINVETVKEEEIS